MRIIYKLHCVLLTCPEGIPVRKTFQTGYLAFRWSGFMFNIASSIKMQLLCLTTLLLSIIRLVYSIEVTPESKCSPLCADDISDPSGIANILDSWTVPDMFVCEDDQLAGPNSTVQGRKWKECLNCELTSTAVDSNEIDLNWFLCKLPASMENSRSTAKKMHDWYKMPLLCSQHEELRQLVCIRISRQYQSHQSRNQVRRNLPRSQL